MLRWLRERRRAATPPSAAGRVALLRLPGSSDRHEVHRDARAAGDPIGLVRPHEVAHPPAIAVAPHHDRVGTEGLGLGDDPLRGLAGSHDLARGGEARLLERRHGLTHDQTLLVPLALVRQQAGVRKPEARAEHAGDREHPHLRLVRAGELERLLQHGPGDRPPLGRDQQSFDGDQRGVGRIRGATPQRQLAHVLIQRVSMTVGAASGSGASPACFGSSTRVR